MFFYLRTLTPIAVDEFTAGVVIEALEWHYGHLNNEMHAARDRADRTGWATAQFRRRATSQLLSSLRNELRELGPMPEEVAGYHADMLRQRGTKMPRSAANAETLSAERAVRTEAEKARKAAYWERVETNRRMAGGRWSRPVITDTAQADDKLGDAATAGK